MPVFFNTINMNLGQAEINKTVIITDVLVNDFKTKIRLMELGLVKNTKIKTIKNSILKKNLLIVFSNSCFTLSIDLAKDIMVEYE